MITTDVAADPHATRRRGVHVLLALLLLLATSVMALHAYALDEHRSGEVCGQCLAHANDGAAPLPSCVGPLFSPSLLPALPCARSPSGTCAVTRYQARAPPV